MMEIQYGNGKIISNLHPGQRIANYKISNHILVANSHQDNYGIDLETGKSTWASLIEFGKPLHYSVQ